MVGILSRQNTLSSGTLWGQEELFQFRGSQRHLGCKRILEGAAVDALVVGTEVCTGAVRLHCGLRPTGTSP